MSDLPQRVQITEEGPREGFQIEEGPIATARKIELIDALSETGLTRIQVVSFVNPKLVPGMADAEQVVAGMRQVPGVDYLGLWLNERGFERALATGRLHIEGRLSFSASEPFLKRNQNRSAASQLADQHAIAETFKRHKVAVETAMITAAFGCNFAGDIAPAHVAEIVQTAMDVAAAHGLALKTITLADTMAWATPLSVKRTLGVVRERFPDLHFGLHLHDTRGMGIANAYAGLEMGVAEFDSSVAGLGGCPFAGHAGAAGNVCTEDLVFMCQEMGIETGIDLERLIECARLAEAIVGHPLPGSVMKGGSLKRLREKLKAA
ncbi:MAG: hydroxymethylglutaryl-CoA lyase [Alphaproteobacteria bacterium]|nr:hydroxymethylglutaryl-CoA lyase [Alphaproteobacteria bacterium]